GERGRQVEAAHRLSLAGPRAGHEDHLRGRAGRGEEDRGPHAAEGLGDGRPRLVEHDELGTAHPPPVLAVRSGPGVRDERAGSRARALPREREVRDGREGGELEEPFYIVAALDAVVEVLADEDAPDREDETRGDPERQVE